MKTPDSQLEKPSRRWFLPMLASFGFGLTSRMSQAADDSIIQPDSKSDSAFIARAFDMRRLANDIGDQPYGAVVVKDGEIIGQSPSRVIVDHDPTAHAEMSALRDAARRNRAGVLSGAKLYSSSHPCAMCEAAAAWVGIVAMIHGEQATDAGRPDSCS
jgi:tRNA(Arg) A34 adenosine deaminase TadA